PISIVVTVIYVVVSYVLLSIVLVFLRFAFELGVLTCFIHSIRVRLLLEFKVFIFVIVKIDIGVNVFVFKVGDEWPVHGDRFAVFNVRNMIAGFSRRGPVDAYGSSTWQGWK